MSLPPERLTVKRSANEAPLDVLYFERPQKRRAPSDWNANSETVQYHYKLKRARSHAVPTPVPEAPALNQPGYPKIGVTKPGEEVGYFAKQEATRKAAEHQKRCDVALSSAAAASQSSAAPLREGGASVRNDKSIPRRLFLDVKASTPTGKRKRSETDSPMAVFAAADSTRAVSQPTTANAPSDTPSNLSQSLTHPRKRPNVRATLSREATLSRNSSRQTLNEEFEKKAQKFAEEEITRSVEIDGMSRSSKLQKITATSDEALEEEYIYDHYVRVPLDHPPPEPKDYTINPSTGLLVIKDDDQEFWELFGEDEEFDENAWNSDQDDENAENWYGADYPEDEVQSDDEYDKDAYQYRHDASDGEEVDPASDEAWSDAEVDEYSYASRKAKPFPRAHDDEFEDIGSPTGLGSSKMANR